MVPQRRIVRRPHEAMEFGGFEISSLSGLKDRSCRGWSIGHLERRAAQDAREEKGVEAVRVPLGYDGDETGYGIPERTEPGLEIRLGVDGPIAEPE